ncbi:MAG: DNA methyltransferase, partial [Candidatus Hodarchaeales archaeon]
MSKSRLNALNGSEWVQWSKSIWRFTEPVTNNYGHPAVFPECLAERVIRCFSKQLDFIVDPMAGTGTSVFVAHGLNRNALGIEISKHWAEIAQKRLQQGPYVPKTAVMDNKNETIIQEKGKIERIPDPRTAPQAEIKNDDARNLLEHVNRDSADLCFTSPPYWTGLHGIKG